MKNKLLFLAIAFTVGLICEANVQARTCAVANGDAQRVTDGATTSGSGVVTSASGKFVCPGDLGKAIFVTNNGGSITALTTISVCTNATTITTTATAIASTTGSFVTWAAVDSTAAINAQVTACKAGAATSYPDIFGNTFVGGDAGIVTMGGGYIVSGCIYAVLASQPTPSIMGAGPYSTVLFLTPTLTSCAGVASKVIGARGAGFTFQGFAIDGGSSAIGTAESALEITQSYRPTVRDVSILNWGVTTGGGRGLQVVLSSDVRLDHILVQGSPSAVDQSTACEISATGVAEGVFCSNHYRNLLIGAPSSRTPSGTGLKWIGGGADECNDPSRECTIVDTNSEFNVDTASFFSTISVRAGAVLHIDNSNVGLFVATERGIAVQIAPTGIVSASDTTFRGNAGGASVVNMGEFWDRLWNKFPTCTGSVCTDRTPAQAFTGKQPVRR